MTRFTDQKDAERTYFKKWYEKNKKILSAKRKKKWREDPEYRRKNLERKQLSRAKEKARCEEMKEEALGRLIALLEEDGMSNAMISKAIGYLPQGSRGYPRVQDVDGSYLVVYPMGYLCVRLARTGQTVRLWHQKDILPPATLTDGQSWRWYSWDYLQACAAAAKKVRESGAWSLKKFKEALEEQ